MSISEWKDGQREMAQVQRGAEARSESAAASHCSGCETSGTKERLTIRDSNKNCSK